MKPRVLIIDDNEAHAEAVEEALDRVGYECVTALTGTKGIEVLNGEGADIVLTDLKLPDLSGIEVLKRAKASDPLVEVIVITGHGSVESAVAAMKEGASDYLTKPLNMEELRTRVAKQVEKQRLGRENRALQEVLDKRIGFEGIAGSSPQMQRIFDVIRQIAPTDTTVLITGESGTGKELVARALHSRSKRRNGPFVPISCAAFAEGVLESELFGHEKGAFTGAIQKRVGQVEAADKGTLFLDEVGEMPLATQVKLLRVIEQREIQRVGANQLLKVDVRFVAATNRNLKTAIGEGSFREDLYFRLKVVHIDLPPLRERRQDIPLLLEEFLSEFARKHGKKLKGMTPGARNVLVAHDWPGNARELRNTIENMVVFGRNDVLDLADIPPDIGGGAGPEVAMGALPPTTVRPLVDLEREAIEGALTEVDGNREKAAQLLGISERTLYRKLKSFDLK
jgi:two-component system response regulator HydG